MATTAATTLTPAEIAAANAIVRGKVQTQQYATAATTGKTATTTGSTSSTTGSAATPVTAPPPPVAVQAAPVTQATTTPATVTTATAAPIAPVATYKPQIQSFNEAMSVQNRLNGLLSNDSTYLQVARTKALQQGQASGLLNSSLTATAGELAAINGSLPIAQQDSSTYNTMATSNQNAYNTAEQFNAGATNQHNQFVAGQLNNTSQFNASAKNSNSQFNSNARNTASQFNANWANDNAKAYASAQNTINLSVFDVQSKKAAQESLNVFNASQNKLQQEATKILAELNNAASMDRQKVSDAATLNLAGVNNDATKDRLGISEKGSLDRLGISEKGATDRQTASDTSAMDRITANNKFTETQNGIARAQGVYTQLAGLPAAYNSQLQAILTNPDLDQPTKLALAKDLASSMGQQQTALVASLALVGFKPDASFTFGSESVTSMEKQAATDKATAEAAATPAGQGLLGSNTATPISNSSRYDQQGSAVDPATGQLSAGFLQDLGNAANSVVAVYDNIKAALPDGTKWIASFVPGKIYALGAAAVMNWINNFTPNEGGAGYEDSSIPAGMGYQTNPNVGPGSGDGYGNYSSTSDSYTSRAGQGE